MKTKQSKMMIKNSVKLLVVIFLMASCSKDDDGPKFQEENFLASFLSQTGFDQKTNLFVNSGSYEFGLFFSPRVKGKITSLKVKLPDVNSSLKVTLWDVEASTVIRTEIVNVATINTDFTFDINDISLEKDKEYAITMNTNDWYDRRKNDGSTVTYPIISGNIELKSYKFISGTSQTLPTRSQTNYYAGDLSFNFIQTK